MTVLVYDGSNSHVLPLHHVTFTITIIRVAYIYPEFLIFITTFKFNFPMVRRLFAASLSKFILLYRTKISKL